MPYRLELGDDRLAIVVDGTEVQLVSLVGRVDDRVPGTQIVASYVIAGVVAAMRGSTV